MNEAYQQYFAGVYDRLMDDMPYRDWQRFVREAWTRYGVQPRTVIDLGCGTGRNAIALARDGLHVIGVDLSEHMLAIAQEQSARSAPAVHAAGGSLTWLQQDMREWDTARQVDSVICLCDGINYLLADTDVQAAFAQTFHGLREGGLFIFDVLTDHQFEHYAAGQPYTYDDDDVAYIWYSDWDADRRVISHELTMFVQKDAESELFLRFQETHRQRAYELHRLAAWLKQAGFRSVDSFADFTWQPAAADTARVFFCAVK